MHHSLFYEFLPRLHLVIWFYARKKKEIISPHVARVHAEG